MSQLPDEVYMQNISKYSTLDFFVVYDEYAEEVKEEGIENFTMYIPVYRKEEAIQEVIKKAVSWLENNVNGWIDMDYDQKAFIEEFKQAIEEQV